MQEITSQQKKKNWEKKIRNFQQRDEYKEGLSFKIHATKIMLTKRITRSDERDQNALHIYHSTCM